MNRDDIIRMAREACGEPAWDGGVEWTWEELERFANLVAAAERNRTWTQDHWTEYERSIAAEEREACAKVAEDMGNISGNMNKTWRNGCFDAAFAIRERGEK
jgi:hypothetical protein